jgi:hypothetical protein
MNQIVALLILNHFILSLHGDEQEDEQEELNSDSVWPISRNNRNNNGFTTLPGGRIIIAHGTIGGVQAKRSKVEIIENELVSENSRRARRAARAELSNFLGQPAAETAETSDPVESDRSDNDEIDGVVDEWTDENGIIHTRKKDGTLLLQFPDGTVSVETFNNRSIAVDTGDKMRRPRKCREIDKLFAERSAFLPACGGYHHPVDRDKEVNARNIERDRF